MVQENYGRAKETFSHTQALWEKEIRRARKETFKSQSSIVKLQEELKSARAATKSAEEVLEREKERGKAREQEAFSARYQIVGVQERLDQALERVKVVEQERDAFKTLAESEEVARIAAEGRLPLPEPAAEDEFASPKRKSARVSLSIVDIVSSAASEAEIDDLTRMWQWEKKRADRALEQVEFLEAECQLRVCSCASARKRRSLTGSVRKERSGPVAIVDHADHMILGRMKVSTTQSPSPARQVEVPTISTPTVEAPRSPTPEKQPSPVQQTLPKGPRHSTIFVPSEGIFRTLSQQDLAAINKEHEQQAEASMVEAREATPSVPVSPVPDVEEDDIRAYARTPSVEPPSFAMMVKERTSLMSLLNAPRESDVLGESLNLDIPTTSVDAPMADAEAENESDAETVSPNPPVEVKKEEEEEQAVDEAADLEERPHTSAAFYTVTTTTTVAVREDEEKKAGVRNVFKFKRAEPSFDVNNPALAPSMTREEALAQIKARRGRARSAMQGAVTPRKQMIAGLGERRDISAPAGRVTKARS